MINGSPEFKKTQWKHVRVGDFLYLRNGDAVPADSIILSTSEPEGNCFVETKDLDGETNLKPRRCVAETNYIQTPEDCAKLDFYIDSEAPNSNLFNFNATLVLTKEIQDDNQPADAPKWSPKKAIPLDINNLLLRAHVIRNTEWIIAATVFTGIDTKIILNSGETPSKRSRIEKEMNREVVFNFFVLLTLALICAVGFVLSIQDLSNDTNGLGPKLLDDSSSSYVEEGFLTFGASLIIFQNIIPISLYISIEFVKTFQAYFIYNDLDMWDEESQKNCVPKSWNLSDDLGQVEYVFSDKTGTLTRNIMEFRQCSISGKIYGRNGWGDKTDAEKGREIVQRVDLDEKNEPATNDIWWKYTQELRKTFDPKYASLNPDFLTFVDHEIFKDMQNEEVTSDVENTPHVKEFFTLLAICHTVVVDVIPPSPKESGDSTSDSSSDQNGNVNNDGLTDTEKKKSSSILGHRIKKKLSSSRLSAIVPSLKTSGILSSSISSRKVVIDDTVLQPLTYKAESPDEAALVSAAKNLGFAFLSRTNHSLTVDILGTEYTFEILNILEFNSTRKRMSTIVRRPKELGDDIVLFCKGADSVIFERLADGQEELIEKTNKDIEEFSNDGLRTLTLAYRILEPSYYETWVEKYREASAAIEDRAELVDACSEEIENDLILLGATAIEDKLQEGVPDCIASLRQAGIKVWVLTGDKLETAINIGFAAQLLTKEMRLWVVKNSNKQEVIRQFDEVVDSLIGQHGIANSGNNDETKERHAFVIDGGALAHLLDSLEAREKMLQVSEVFHSVICCRVSPLQKALVVDLVKKGKKAITLSIGDGANDVSMIQAANVGVGISGQEGVQASMAADYAISQFRFLKKLLLVHGHWDYLRIAEMILNFFYKNVIWVFPVLWYQIYCQFSANIFYDYSLVQLYNMIFTVAPVVALGGTDQSVTAKYCMQYPGIYALGIKRTRYSRSRFAIYFLDGIWQSLVVYFVSHLVYLSSQNVTSDNGYSSGSAEMSTAVAVTAIIIANLFVGFNTYYWTWFMFATVIAEIVSIFAFVFGYGAFQSTTLYGIAPELFARGEFWVGLVLGVLVAGLPRYLVTFVKQWWYPDDLDIVRQIKTREKEERIAGSKRERHGNTNNINVPDIEVNPA